MNSHEPPLDKPTLDEALMERVVYAFYARIRRDPMLGPIFEEHVTDWSHHLPAMVAFWRRTVLHTGDYSGRPMEAHQRIPGLGAGHFERWLELWAATVEEVAPPAAQDALLVPARGIAASIQAVLMRTD